MTTKTTTQLSTAGLENKSIPESTPVLSIGAAAGSLALSTDLVVALAARGGVGASWDGSLGGSAQICFCLYLIFFYNF